jgi:hypothetical protein
MAKLTVAEVKPGTGKDGKPYLRVKTSNGNTVWVHSDNQIIFHKFVPGANLNVETRTSGNFTVVVGVHGDDEENASRGNSGAGNGTQEDGAIPFILEKIKEIDSKVSWLVEDRKALNSLPKLEDLPIHHLEDKKPF